MGGFSQGPRIGLMAVVMAVRRKPWDIYGARYFSGPLKYITGKLRIVLSPSISDHLIWTHQDRCGAQHSAAPYHGNHMIWCASVPWLWPEGGGVTVGKQGSTGLAWCRTGEGLQCCVLLCVGEAQETGDWASPKKQVMGVVFLVSHKGPPGQPPSSFFG